ncbi:MAG: hypothetical protein QQW96_23425 [Tychonema bourrellyi B0820]|nr:hypothetical protein [Tychonema bourrellyi B0820]
MVSYRRRKKEEGRRKKEEGRRPFDAVYPERSRRALTSESKDSQVFLLTVRRQQSTVNI